MDKMKFNTIEVAVEAIKNGKFVIVVDDESRENEGDLVLAAEKADAEKINFMIKHARGLVCIPITQEKADSLELNRMAESKDKYDTSFTVSVDSVDCDTGISAEDRLRTIKAILNPDSKPNDLVRPGHSFPLIAKEGGVLERAGHTEASLDLVEKAGFEKTAVICEIMNDDGSMARLPDLFEFAKKFGLKIVTVKDLVKRRMERGLTIKPVAEAFLPTKFGEFRAIGFKDEVHGHEYLALIKGNVKGKENVLVRVHSACLTGDVFHSMRCDCVEQLDSAIGKIENEKEGVILYIPHHEGRGIGLLNKLRAYQLQDKGKDTVEANLSLGFRVDARDFGFGAQILKSIGLTTIRLLTNNPWKIKAIDGFGLKVVEQVPLKVKPNKFNSLYLEMKRKKMGHNL